MEVPTGAKKVGFTLGEGGVEPEAGEDVLLSWEGGDGGERVLLFSLVREGEEEVLEDCSSGEETEGGGGEGEGLGVAAIAALSFGEKKPVGGSHTGGEGALPLLLLFEVVSLPPPATNACHANSSAGEPSSYTHTLVSSSLGKLL